MNKRVSQRPIVAIDTSTDDDGHAFILKKKTDADQIKQHRNYCGNESGSF